MRFTEILFTLTLICGFIWLIDSLFFSRRRTMRMFPNMKGQVQEPVLVEYAKAFFPVLLLVLVIRSFVVEPFRIPSGSMRPTLLEGDFILVNKYDYGLRAPFTGSLIKSIGHPKRGDVIVFKHMKNGESIDLIKRIVGLPGDHVQYKDKTIYVNNEPIKQDFIEDRMDKDPDSGNTWQVRYLRESLGNVSHDFYIRPDSPYHRHRFDDTTVPPGSYFVMGDNRDNSDDSRSWGFVNDDDILGRAMFIWMSWDSSQNGFINCLKHCIRWDRIGKNLGTELQNEKRG